MVQTRPLYIVTGGSAQGAVVAGRFGERVKSTLSGRSRRPLCDRKREANRKFHPLTGSSSQTVCGCKWAFYSSGSPALRSASRMTGTEFVLAARLTVSVGSRRRASAKAVFASSILPLSA